MGGVQHRIAVARITCHKVVNEPLLRYVDVATEMTLWNRLIRSGFKSRFTAAKKTPTRTSKLGRAVIHSRFWDSPNRCFIFGVSWRPSLFPSGWPEEFFPSGRDKWRVDSEPLINCLCNRFWQFREISHIAFPSIPLEIKRWWRPIWTNLLLHSIHLFLTLVFEFIHSVSSGRFIGPNHHCTRLYFQFTK